METLNVKADDLCRLARTLLERDVSVRVTGSGSSMSPFIEDGDTIEISPVAVVPKVRRGDIVLCQSDEDAVAHRVVKIRSLNGNRQFGLRADNGGGLEWIMPSQIIGRVVSRTRTGHRLKLDGLLRRYLGWTYCMLSPSRRLFWRLLGAVLQRVQSTTCYRQWARAMVLERATLESHTLAEGFKLVARNREGRPVGGVEFAKHGDCWEVFGLWVPWRYRRLGIGEQLMQAVFAATKGERVRLFVFRRSKPAIKLYLKLGFCQTESTETEITMEKDPASGL